MSLRSPQTKDRRKARPGLSPLFIRISSGQIRFMLWCIWRVKFGKCVPSNGTVVVSLRVYVLRHSFANTNNLQTPTLSTSFTKLIHELQAQPQPKPTQPTVELNPPNSKETYIRRPSLLLWLARYDDGTQYGQIEHPPSGSTRLNRATKIVRIIIAGKKVGRCTSTLLLINKVMHYDTWYILQNVPVRVSVNTRCQAINLG